MKPPRPRTPGADEDLVLYFDGELAAREARAVEERLERSPEDQTKLEAMKEVQAVLRAHYEAHADHAAPRLAALWARIEDQLDAPAARLRPERPGVLAAIRDWLDAYRGYVWTGAVAAAAGVILTLGATRLVEPEARVEVVERVVYRDRPVAGDTQMAVHVEAEPPEQTEVESLEVEGGTGTIFQIPGTDREAATTVIWIQPAAAGGDEPI